MSFSQRLPSLTHRHFRNWIVGSFISNLGGQLQTWGMFWHLDAMTHQPLAVGYVGLVRVIPLLLLGLFGGVVADQRDRRKVLLATQTGMASTAVAMSAITLTGQVSPLLIYVLIFVEAIFRAYNGPVRQAMIPNLIPHELLPNALGINGVQWRLSEVLGPALSGLLIWVLGPHSGLVACYGLNALSFLALIAAVIQLPSMPPKVERSRGAREVLVSIGEGFSFLKASPVIANAMWIDFWGTLLAGAQALLPAFVRAELGLGPAWYGIMAAAGGVGAMFASVALTWMPPIRRQGIWVIGMIAAFGAFTLVFGLTHNFWLAALAYAGIGASDMVSTVLRQTIRQLAIPDHMRGRLSSIGMIFQISGPQLGDYEAAAIAQARGIRTSLVVGACGALFVSFWYRTRGKLKDYEHAMPVKL